jgi:predicted alpha/beta hydrolase family esterase
MPEEESWPELPDLGPPQPIEHVYFFHGWTLNPKRPGWYENTARFVRKGFDIGATVVELPDTDNPDPNAWQACINETVTDPASSILVLHSLSFINGFRCVSDRKLDDPYFQVGGILGVGANISAYVSDELRTDGRSRVQSAIGNKNLSPKPFADIAHHYIPDVGEFIVRCMMVRLAARQIAFAHGAHDPFVPLNHGLLIADKLDADVYVDPDAAHFSGEFNDPSTGLYIPPCEFNATVAFILSKMIMGAAPEGRYTPAGGMLLYPQVIRQH